MPVKSVHSPFHGHSVKFGRRRPVAFHPRFAFKQFVDKATLPTAPTTSDYRAAADSVLRDIMLNDQLGDCVIAGGYHLTGLETGNATGTAFHATSTYLIADYHAIGGYNPNDPSSDQGCDEETAFAYWLKHGFANGTKIIGRLAIDPTNVDEIKLAMWLFENLFFGVELPDAWINPFPSGDNFAWQLAGAPDPDNGHAFVGVGHSESGIVIDTWGIYGLITYDAIAKYCSESAGGQIFVILTPDQLAKAATKAPNGVDWSAIVAAFNSLGGNAPVPSPAPTPTPPPAPVPSSGPTLKQAKSAVRSAIKKGPKTMTQTRAIDLVDAALVKLWPTN